MSDQPGIIDFLKKSHLFRNLKDEQLKSVAAELKDKPCEEGEIIFREGDVADSLYIVYQGRIQITRKVKGKGQEKDHEIKLASMNKWEYFGEQGLLGGRKRNATARAEKGTILLVMYRQPFKQLFKQIPGMREMFDVVITSRQMANQLRFKWLGPDEDIYFLARRHFLILLRVMILPVLLGVALSFPLWWAYTLGSATLGLVFGFLALVDLAWAIWSFVDWGNDYYIVTDQRVIWLEKVIGLYDSRTEAGMGTILSVGTESDFFGRWLDYGTVVVRTFTGQIRMAYVTHPKQAAAMIDDYWSRSKEGAKQADVESVHQTIKKKLGYGPPAPPPAAPAKPAKKPSRLQLWWNDAFKMRIEASGVVTYRKHIYVLFRDTAGHMLGFLTIAISPWLWTSFISATIPASFWSFLALFFCVVAGMWVYEYIDWANDLYQVSGDQIIDVSRKPFGTEERKAAPLENILSTEYKRRGIIGMFFNFGTVYIQVGGAQFNFEDVFDPPTVQQDIVRRQQARQIKKKESETAADRERLAEWLAQYHRTVEEINKEKGQS